MVRAECVSECCSRNRCQQSVVLYSCCFLRPRRQVLCILLAERPGFPEEHHILLLGRRYSPEGRRQRVDRLALWEESGEDSRVLGLRC